MEGVRVAGPGDAELVGSIHARGFALDPVMRWVFGPPCYQDKLDAVWRFLARVALVPLGHTYICGDSCAAWTPPDAPGWPAERNQRFGALLAATCEPGEARRLGALDEILAVHRPKEPIWYLGSIATAPSSQGQGLGSQLLAESLAVVDRNGLPTYLEASSARSIPLYERHGFRTVEELTLADGPTLVAMLRPPAPTTPSA